MGVVAIEKAQQLADESNLDLLLVSDNSTPPVCKIVNIGQHKYQQQKKDKLAKKNVKGQVIKELKMSPKISEHDYQVRVDRGLKFLKKGYKVKLTIFFRGREIIHPELGTQLGDRFIEALKEHGKPESALAKTKRFLNAVIAPN